MEIDVNLTHLGEAMELGILKWSKRVGPVQEMVEKVAYEQEKEL